MNRFLSTLVAAGIAVTTLGTTMPASAASLVPAAPAAASQTADSLLVEVSKKRGGKRFGKRFGFKFHYGGHFGYAHCWTTKKVWTKYGWRFKKFYICY